MLPNKIQLRYMSATPGIASSGGDLPQFLAVEDPSNDLNTITWEPVGVGDSMDWTNAFGWFLTESVTPELRGLVFAVRASVGRVLTTVLPLPVAPSSGDVFVMVGGLGLTVDDLVSITRVNAMRLSESEPLTARFITAVELVDVEADVDLYLRYDASLQQLQLSTNGADWGDSGGVSIDVSGSSDVVGELLQAPTGEWLVVNVEVASLPVATVTEVLLVSPVSGTFLPELWMDNDNSVIHHYVALCNEGEKADVADVRIEHDEEVTTAVLASEYNEGESGQENTLVLSGASGLPARDFWLYLNTSAPDVRYVTKRADNICYLADTSKWQEVPFDHGDIAPPPLGSVITSSGGESGVLQACYITSGSWGSSAAGVMILSDSTGLFADEDSIVYGVAFASVDGGGYYGIRGLPRQTIWGAGETVQVYPAYDVLVVEPPFETVLGSRKPLSVAASFAPWTPIATGYIADTVVGLASGNTVGLVLRRYLLDELCGTLSTEYLLNLRWD